MGSGDWFKIITWKKTKQVKGATGGRTNGFKCWNQNHKGSYKLNTITASGHTGDFGTTIEDIAATRIQMAFRRFRARKTLRCLKGVKRLQGLNQVHDTRKQASTTLNYVKSWSRIQAEIRARRACMVTEGHIRQKKHDTQLKLDAKIHDLEVEWSGGSETMEEILSRLQQREEAAVKRERAMAYAFSHQWRANSGLNLGYEFGKGTWGWSWTERWIAARPWESRLPVPKPAGKAGKKRSPQPMEQKTVIQEPPKTKNGKMK